MQGEKKTERGEPEVIAPAGDGGFLEILLFKDMEVVAVFPFPVTIDSEIT